MYRDQVQRYKFQPFGTRTFIQALINDYRFWIFLFFCVRLIGITHAPLEVGHNWRQTTVTMVARNFYEVDANILYPRVDMAGTLTGITGMEFPVLNYLIYLVSEVFGYDHWYGRLINLIFSSIGCWYFFAIVRRFLDEKVAFYAGMVLLGSLWFSFSRKIMPDTFSVSLCMIGMHYGMKYLYEKGKQLSLVYFALFFGLGVLAKLPSAYLGILFILPFFDGEVKSGSKFLFFLVSLGCLAPAVYWYFIWVPYLVQEYGYWHFYMGKGFLEGASDIVNNLPATLSRFYESALRYSGFVLFVAGIVVAWIRREPIVLRILLFAFLGWLVVMLKAGFAFHHHNYYIIPFVPIMALVAGFAISRIHNPVLALIVVFGIIGEGVGSSVHDFAVKDTHKPFLALEQKLDKFTDRSDLIAINSPDYPTPFYFAHRKGWQLTNEQLTHSTTFDRLEHGNYKLIVILKKAFGENIKLDKKVIYQDEDFTFYKVK